MALYTSNLFTFAKPPDFNILIHILCLVIVVFYNNSMYIDCKIADALLKKGTNQHVDGWDTSSKDWAHMVLQLPHTEGGFGVPFNCVTKDATFYTTTSRFVVWLGAFPQERQELWLPKDDLRDSSSWSSPPLVLLRDIHSKLIDQYG
jgi:hypothetical protein